MPEMNEWEQENQKLRKHKSINIANKNSQTIVGSTMIIMVFAYFVDEY